MHLLTERQRKTAREIFTRSLAQTTVAAAVERKVWCDGSTFWVDRNSYELSRYSEVCIVSIGKAGATLYDAIDAVLPQNLPRRAVISAPSPPLHDGPDISYFQGGHPEPNLDSVAAAAAALRCVGQCPADALVLFMISGGASAMCELPIDDRITLEDMVHLHRLLIGSGASISEVNSVRKHFSRIKGGRLAVAAGLRDKVSLLISDVPSTSLDAVGSGPGLPDSSSTAECLDVLQRYDLQERLPASMQSYIERGMEESPKIDNAAFRNQQIAVLLSNETFLEQAGRVAEELGYTVTFDSSCDEWDYQDAASYLLGRLGALRSTASRVALLSGGELTVRLPDAVGAGGRNQQFCLHCASGELPPGVAILSAGTDGVDGNSVAAGGVVDFTTVPRGEQRGMKIEGYLSAFDANTYLSTLGDDIVTGPTGNNLRDIRILLAEDTTIGA